jgi:hypothetical protein
MPKKADAVTAERLKELADAEVAAAKERLTKRTEAAARFASAEARLVAARTIWEATQGAAATDKAAAVEQLLDTGMKPAQVAELLGLDAKELRTLRATGANRPAAGTGDVPADPATVALADQHHNDPSHQAA